MWGTGAGTFQDVFPAYRADCMRHRRVLGDGSQRCHLKAWLTFGGAFLVAAVIAYVTLIATYAKGLRAAALSLCAPRLPLHFVAGHTALGRRLFVADPSRGAAGGVVAGGRRRRFRGAFERRQRLRRDPAA